MIPISDNLIKLKMFYLSLYLPAQKGPTESKVNPEGHWLLRSPMKERTAKSTPIFFPGQSSLGRHANNHTHDTNAIGGNKQEWKTRLVSQELNESLCRHCWQAAARNRFSV